MNNVSKSLYRIGQVICRIFFRLFFRVKVIGKENIPATGGVLLCCNHISLLDPPLLGAFIDRNIRFMAKGELFNVPVLKGLITKLGAFPVQRGKSDMKALRTGIKLLKEGEVLGIFPEGTRSKTGELGKGLAGVGFFALRTNAAVVPCAIVGKYRLFSKLYLVYGEPINMESLKEAKASADVVTENIMQGIEKLINEHKK